MFKREGLILEKEIFLKGRLRDHLREGGSATCEVRFGRREKEIRQGRRLYGKSQTGLLEGKDEEKEKGDGS